MDHPPFLHPPYASTVRRAPRELLIPLVETLAQLSGPVFGEGAVREWENDLTRNAVRGGEPIGERIIVTGRVLDEAGRPVRSSLIEVWQANSAGRYVHAKDDHDAPLDPNFTGTGRCLTNERGEYTFTTIRPGAYPWRNHANAWRPPHIHFSVFGRDFAQRLVTQMYFAGDPLLRFDPIFTSVPGEAAQRRLLAAYDHSVTQPDRALGFRFDIVLTGGRSTPLEAPHD